MQYSIAPRLKLYLAVLMSKPDKTNYNLNVKQQCIFPKYIYVEHKTFKQINRNNKFAIKQSYSPQTFHCQKISTSTINATSMANNQFAGEGIISAK